MSSLSNQKFEWQCRCAVLDHSVALLVTKMRKIHNRCRIVCQDSKNLACAHVPQPSPGLQYGEWTLQTGRVQFGIPILIHTFPIGRLETNVHGFVSDAEMTAAP